MSIYDKSITIKDDVKINYENIKTNNLDEKYEFKQIQEDPYLQYIENKGLTEHNTKVIYKTEYINIDSRDRNKIPKIFSKKVYQLNSDPFIINGDELKIKLNNTQDINVGDKITIKNTLYYYKIASSITNNLPIIEFVKNKKYAKIYLNPNINLDSSFDNLYKYIQTDDLYVSITGVMGTISQEIKFNNTPVTIYKDDINSSYIGNIPINFINNIHRIYLSPPDEVFGTISTNVFYIKLPYESNGSNFADFKSIYTNFPYPTETYNIKFTFYHYNTIPINEIDADYPVNSKQKTGYHIVKKKDDDYIYITIKPRINDDIVNISKFTSSSFGGNNIYVTLIDKIVPGYLSPSQFTINLDRTYNNIFQVTLKEATFYNPSKTVRNNINNKLYFQNIDNLKEIQTIELEEGLYTFDSLKNSLEQKFYNTTRNDNNTNYEQNYIVDIDINKYTNIFSIKSYKKAILSRPISKTDPVINDSENKETIGIGTYILTIKHINHGITQINTPVIFKKFIEHMGITNDVINTIHYITKIVDEHNYEITLKNINLSLIKNNTNGGYSCEVYVPSPMRFYFNYNDTMGNVLGFRNVGQSTSITTFNYITSNNDLYDKELNIDANGNQVIIKNNKIVLKDYNYFLIVCKQLKSMTNIGKIKDIFSKIIIDNHDILYDTFVKTPIIFNDPIYELFELTFELYDPNGNLLNIDNMDYSIVIELLTIDNQPELTGINSNLIIKK